MIFYSILMFYINHKPPHLSFLMLLCGIVYSPLPHNIHIAQCIWTRSF